MPESARRPSTAHVLAAITLLQRFSTELDVVASEALASGRSVPNVDITALSALHSAVTLSPTELAEAIGLPRSTTSRAIARLAALGLLEREQRSDDGRRADLRLTASGQIQVNRFSDALFDFFIGVQATVKEALVLLGHDPEGLAGAPGVGPLDLVSLMSSAGSAFVTEVTPAVRPFGITTAMDRYAIVMVADRGQVRPFQLAEELVLTPPGVSSLLDRLEAAELITRHQGVVVDDGRGIVVRLTPHGSRAAEAVVRVFRRHETALTTAIARVLSVTR